MPVRCVIVFLVSFFIPVIAIHAQQVRMSYYTVNEGLPSNTIRKIFQDKRGNIWICTIEGISKYDGERFTNYNKTNGLPHNLVNDMLETETGILFFACNDGSVAGMQYDRIIKVTHPGAVINQFCKLKNGKVLAATDAGGIQEFRDGELFKPLQPFPGSSYFSLAAINEDLFLAGSDYSVQILTHEYKLVKSFGQSSVYYGGNAVLKDSYGRMWASQLPHPLQLPSCDTCHSISLNIPELKLKGADIQQIYEDKSGNVWFAGSYGLVQLSPAGKLRVIKKKNGLLSDIVHCVFQDREENLWIGTSLGLCKMPHINVALASYDETNNLAYPFINSMFSDKTNGLVVSTRKGWQYFDEKTGKFSSLFSASEVPLATKDQLSFQPMYTEVEHPFISDQKAEAIIAKFFTMIKPGQVLYRINDGRGCFFISVGRYFYVYDGHQVFEDSTLGFSGNGNFTITGMAIDPSGDLWIGTWEEGLFKLKYQIQDSQFHFTKKETVLPKIPIRTIMLDKEGNLWAGTRYHGVYRIKQTSDGHYMTQNWNTETGLASNWVHGLYEDEKHNVWLLLRDGLDKMVKEGNEFRAFNFSRVNNFFENFYCILSAGNRSLWLGTSNGLVRMQDGEMETLPPWNVNITSIGIGDSIYHRERMPAVLSYKRNSLKIDFSAPTYINEKQVLYSYRLIGSRDTMWSSTGNIHSVSYANLQPEYYRFEVRTKGWNGQWGPITALNFTIQPPLWQRGWFIAVSGLLLAAGITFLVFRRIKQIKEDAAIKQQLTETEMMALRAQMNPHFLFNSLNAIDSLIQTNQPDKATTYLGRFARLLRLVLDSSKNKLVPFDRDFSAIQLYLDMEKFRSAGKFEFTISAEPELLNGGYSIPPLLVQPFIENAIHHGLMNKQSDDRQLTVQASLQNDLIVFEITDNGVGRARSKELNALNRPDHTSYGWQITAQRLGLHNKGKGEDYVRIDDLYKDNEPCGTRVTLQIKVNAS